MEQKKTGGNGNGDGNATTWTMKMEKCNLADATLALSRTADATPWGSADKEILPRLHNSMPSALADA